MATDQMIQPTQTTEPQGPPMPKALYRIVNPIMSAILRLPLHGLMSNSLMLLIYDGRNSGKRYVLPVGYVQDGDHLYLFTHSGWWKNFVGGAPVAVRLRGKLLRGTAIAPVDDPAVIQKVVRHIVADRGESMVERMGLLHYLDPDKAHGATPRSTTFIEIKLEDQA